MFGVGYSQLSRRQPLGAAVRKTTSSAAATACRSPRSSSSYQKRYDFSFTNPYFTDEGMSLGYNLWWREFDYCDLRRGQLLDQQRRVPGLPGPADHRVRHGLGAGSASTPTRSCSPPARRARSSTTSTRWATRTFHAWRTQFGYSRDTRNDYFMPSAGSYQRAGIEIAMPGSTAEYCKVEYQYSQLLAAQPVVDPAHRRQHRLRRQLRRRHLSRPVREHDGALHRRRPTTSCARSIADGLPFFENFYAGGISSSGRVRGFVDNSLGPREFNGFSVAADRWLAEDRRHRGTGVPEAVRLAGRAHFGVPRLRQRVRPTSTPSTRASCAPRPVSRCCGARRWARWRSATRCRCARRTPIRRRSTGRRHRAPAVHLRRVVLTATYPGNDTMGAPAYTAAELGGAFRSGSRGRRAARRARRVDARQRGVRIQLGFLANPRYRAQLADSHAGVVVMRAEDAEGYRRHGAGRTRSVRRVREASPPCSNRVPQRRARHPSFRRRRCRAQRSIRRRTSARTVVIGARSTVGAGAVIGPGCVDRRGLRHRRRLRTDRARHAGDARAPGQARARASRRGARRRRLRPGDGRRPLAEGAAARRRGDRRRLRDRRQHHHRPRRARRHRPRRRRAPGQPDPDRPQRLHRRAHGDGRLRRGRRQREDRPLLPDRRRRRRPRATSRCATG